MCNILYAKKKTERNDSKRDRKQKQKHYNNIGATLFLCYLCNEPLNHNNISY